MFRPVGEYRPPPPRPTSVEPGGRFRLRHSGDAHYHRSSLLRVITPKYPQLRGTCSGPAGACMNERPHAGRHLRDRHPTAAVWSPRGSMTTTAGLRELTSNSRRLRVRSAHGQRLPRGESGELDDREVLVCDTAERDAAGDLHVEHQDHAWIPVDRSPRDALRFSLERNTSPLPHTGAGTSARRFALTAIVRRGHYRPPSRRPVPTGRRPRSRTGSAGAPACRASHVRTATAKGRTMFRQPQVVPHVLDRIRQARRSMPRTPERPSAGTGCTRRTGPQEGASGRIWTGMPVPPRRRQAFSHSKGAANAQFITISPR